MQIGKEGLWSFIDAAHIHILLSHPSVHPLIPPHKINVPLLSNMIDLPLCGKALGNFSPKLFVTLVEKEIVADVHNIWRIDHLNHVHLYTKAGRLLSNFAEYSAAESLNTRCLQCDIGHVAYPRP